MSIPEDALPLHAEYSFTLTQLRAIQQLERALSACKKAGLRLHGFDNTILAIPYRQAVRRYGEESVHGEHDAWRVGSITVENDGAYLDSGGF